MYLQQYVQGDWIKFDSAPVVMDGPQQRLSELVMATISKQ